eukprot:6201194-Pleurochrysis_carterae.AAC.1
MPCKRNRHLAPCTYAHGRRTSYLDEPAIRAHHGHQNCSTMQSRVWMRALHLCSVYIYYSCPLYGSGSMVEASSCSWTRHGGHGQRE